MAYPVNLQLSKGFPRVFIEMYVYLDPVPRILREDGRGQRSYKGFGPFIGFSLDIDVVIAEAREVDALLFGRFVERPTVIDIGVDPNEVSVFRVGAEKPGRKEQRRSEPEVVPFDYVVWGVAVEDAPRVRRAFRRFDMDFEGSDPRIGLTRVPHGGAAGAVGTHLIKVVRGGGGTLETSQSFDDGCMSWSGDHQQRSQQSERKRFDNSTITRIPADATAAVE